MPQCRISRCFLSQFSRIGARGEASASTEQRRYFFYSGTAAQLQLHFGYARSPSAIARQRATTIDPPDKSSLDCSFACDICACQPLPSVARVPLFNYLFNIIHLSLPLHSLGRPLSISSRSSRSSRAHVCLSSVHRPMLTFAIRQHRPRRHSMPRFKTQ